MNELVNVRINGNAEQPISRREFAEAIQLLGRVLGRLEYTLNRNSEQLNQIAEHPTLPGKTLDSGTDSMPVPERSIEEPEAQ